MTDRLCACGFLLSTALIVSAAERITIAVSPLQSMAPTNVRVRVHVTPDADNRVLELSADSGGYYRSNPPLRRASDAHLEAGDVRSGFRSPLCVNPAS